MDDKVDTINTSKNNMVLLIDNTLASLSNNIQRIEDNKKKHNDFINFVEVMKIYEIYKWTGLKMDYNQIKKNVNKDKKLLGKITKNYGKIIGYFDQDNIDVLNDKIKKICELKQLMLYYFVNLKKAHDDVHNKCKYMVKNDQITKIAKLTDDIKPLIQKLYENYIDIQFVNKQTNNLKSIKMSIVGEISKINEIKITNGSV
jgi:hypothetical protein